MSEQDDWNDQVDELGEQPQQRAPRQSLGSVDDAMGGGTPAAKFDKIGTVVEGIIESCDTGQQRDIKTGKSAFWDDGNPKLQVLVVLQTSERSADIDDDDGRRLLYVKCPSAMRAAIHKALGKTKLSQSIGGKLAVKYTGDGEPTTRGFNAPKQFAARFTPAGDREAQPEPPYPQHAPINGVAAAMTAAQRAFKVKFPNTPNDELLIAWAEKMKGYFPGRQAELIGVADWQKFASDGFVKPPVPNPFEGPMAGEGIPEDDIPF